VAADGGGDGVPAAEPVGVNLASCAILMGAGIWFTPGGRRGPMRAAAAALAAMVLGMAGMLEYTKQAVECGRRGRGWS